MFPEAEMYMVPPTKPAERTLRDEFAMAALAGMLAGEPGSHLSLGPCARDCYRYADAMLAERAK